MAGAISARLFSAAELVRQGAVLADIGTDHAYLPLFLLSEGRIRRAVCSDINEGPLDSARKHARELGFDGDIDFVLCDGAAALAGRGITDYTVCGMGGELIAAIIDRAPSFKDTDINLILQPMSRQGVLRKYLASHGFEIKCESYSSDSGKYYVTFLVNYTGRFTEIDDVEAELGVKSAQYVNKDAQICYLKAKLAAFTKQRDGKIRGGDNAEKEALLAEKAEELIAALTNE